MSDKKIMNKGRGMALGLALGAAIGVATDNFGLWLALGVVFGSAFEARIASSKKEEESHSQTSTD